MVDVAAQRNYLRLGRLPRFSPPSLSHWTTSSIYDCKKEVVLRDYVRGYQNGYVRSLLDVCRVLEEEIRPEQPRERLSDLCHVIQSTPF